MYAITDSGYRSISAGMELLPGETAAADVPTSLLQRIAADRARASRTQLLRGTDWTQMQDAPLSAEQKQLWAVYRQKLRDLPEDCDFPDCVWPEVPSA